MEIVTEVYEFSKNLPKEEIYGLISQIRRAAVSIAANIAEGSQRSSNRDFANFILISRGSLAELETELLIAIPQSPEHAQKEGELILLHLEELSRMLHAFHASLKTHNS